MIDVVDLTAGETKRAAPNSTIEAARDRLYTAITDVVLARRALFHLDARAATEVELALVGVMFKHGGAA